MLSRVPHVRLSFASVFVLQLPVHLRLRRSEGKERGQGVLENEGTCDDATSEGGNNNMK
jgi:hypothetical protein